jgi:hypothetical protein
MHWSCQLPGFAFDPGDQNPIVLRINCLNSVDTTTVLEISLSWFRLVCSNGMMFGLRENKLRQRHVHSLDPEDIVNHLQSQLEQVGEEQSHFQAWLGLSIEREHVEEWIDTDVAKNWGPHAACRIWHIISLGVDGEVESGREKQLPAHLLSLRGQTPVPGARVPGTDLFHISQALSWFAGTRNTVQERLEYIKQIPSLIGPLSEV